MTAGRDTPVSDARQQVEDAHRQLRRAERALAEEYPEAAQLTADLVAETEALAEVLAATDEQGDRWAGVSPEVAQR